MDLHKLSIIIPHFNTPILLYKLLKTIPMIPEIQIIVIDDRSDLYKEQFCRCVEYFKNRGVEFYVNEKEKGAGTCRNIGLEKASGEWLLFADADDFFVNNFYLTILKFLHSDADLIYFIPTSLNLDTEKLGTRHLPYQRLVLNYLKSKKLINELQLRYEFVSPCSKLVRRKLVSDNHIFFDRVLTANDIMFSVKAAFYAHKIDASAENIYCITRTSNSLTSNISIEKYEIRLHVFFDKYNFLLNHLTKKEFKMLSPSARGFIIRALKGKYGFKKTIKILRLIKKHRIPFCSWNIINPFYFCQLLMENRKSYKDKKYFYK